MPIVVAWNMMQIMIADAENVSTIFYHFPVTASVADTRRFAHLPLAVSFKDRTL
jgi:hypothetical protein